MVQRGYHSPRARVQTKGKAPRAVHVARPGDDHCGRLVAAVGSSVTTRLVKRESAVTAHRARREDVPTATPLADKSVIAVR